MFKEVARCGEIDKGTVVVFGMVGRWSEGKRFR